MLIGELVPAEGGGHQAEVRQSIPVTDPPAQTIRSLLETSAVGESQAPGAQTGSRFAFFLHLLRLWPCFFLHFLSAAARSPVGALV